MFKFLSKMGMKKAEGALESFTQAVVAFDPETASDAQISLMEEGLDDLGRKVAEAEQAVAKDRAETKTLTDQYDKYMAAAERLQEQIATAQEQKQASSGLQDSLTTVVETLEGLTPEIEREREEDVEAEAFAAELREAYDAAAERLKGARKKLQEAQRNMERADQKKERAKEKEDAVRAASGLSSSMSGLDVALSAMTKEADEANAEAAAADLKVGAFGEKKLDDDPNIAAALQGEDPNAGKSAMDRLAALKK